MSDKPDRSVLPTIRGASPGMADLAPDPAVVQTVWARVLMDSLRRAGVTLAVVSPGSRSTPFTLAAEYVGLSTHAIIDERSAGFFALGHARATATPALLICTSGSAGAHYYPAVIEAAHAHIPLIVLTADRPPELHGCCAPQTVDQTRLYGDHVRMSVDLGVPDGSRTSLRALCRKAAQIAHTARSPVPGPVHINARARKPLEPAAPKHPADLAVVERAEAILQAFSPRVGPSTCVATGGLIGALERACVAAERGLIAAGPMTMPAPRERTHRVVRAAYELARVTGYPLLVEASSQLRFVPADVERDGVAIIDAFDLVVADAHLSSTLQPDLVIQIGLPPTSAAWAKYMRGNADCVHCVIAEYGWPDPHASADLLIHADVYDTMTRVADAIRTRIQASSTRGEWTHRWTHANQLAWRAVEKITRVAPLTDGGTMAEGQAMRASASAIPEAAWLLLGNSLPIRAIDTYAPAMATGVRVLCQRGANGIDGFVSAAAGASFAAVRDERGLTSPVIAIIGDVSFVHDIGGLWAAARTRGRLCVIVIDNDGGRIFEQLPIASAAHGIDRELYEAHFLTPPRVDMEAATRLCGGAYVRVEAPDALRRAIVQACGHPGLTLVHALVRPDSARDDLRAISGQLAEYLNRYLDEGWELDQEPTT